MVMTEQNKMRKKMANTIRFLAADMVQKANSGHPGAPMGLADIAVVLSEKLSHNPKNPKWLNRDRLVFLRRTRFCTHLLTFAPLGV